MEKNKITTSKIAEILVMIFLFLGVSLGIWGSLNVSNTHSYFEKTDNITGQIKVKGVQLKIYQDTGDGYKDVTKDGFDLATDYFVPDKKYDYDMIIKNDDKATVKAEEYYLRWWFTANIDGTNYDITDDCEVATAFVYKQQDSDGRTRFYSVNGSNSNTISAQTQLTFLTGIKFPTNGQNGSILDKEASGSKVKITAHIEGSLSAYSIVKPSVKVYDSEGNIVQETTLADGQTTITLPRVGYGSKEIDGETLYFQGWLKNGVVAQVYTPNETVEVNGGEVFTPYYAQDPDNSDFTFTVDSVTGEYIISGANKDMTTATIPALYQGQPVSVVNERAFFSYSSLQKVILPQTITKIGEYAFRDCELLTSITIPDSVTEIAKGAFYCCDSLNSIEIPDSVTSIGAFTFYSCDSLTSIEIPDSVTSIGNNAFDYCTNLTSITIPDSVTNIGKRAFACTGLTSINVDSNNKSYCSIEGVLFNKDVTELIQYPTCKTDTNYIIPTSVTSIGASAFYGCDRLISITFENTSGWYMTTSSSYTGGSSIDVSNPTTNATSMVSVDWRTKYLYRS